MPAAIQVRMAQYGGKDSPIAQMRSLEWQRVGITYVSRRLFVQQIQV